MYVNDVKRQIVSYFKCPEITSEIKTKTDDSSRADDRLAHRGCRWAAYRESFLDRVVFRTKRRDRYSDRMHFDLIKEQST